ncbi:hypothetical protein AXG89_29795 (plasmid) [Burkholderia sp. PAMC 26561]|nr:hypothetical protein AXG89_22885 [Burkholderia sp. PAMC 26561]AME28011.1 hypothetical protein AXG89_29795 [Burkholderia sp. PAMC 26561]
MERSGYHDGHPFAYRTITADLDVDRRLKVVSVVGRADGGLDASRISESCPADSTMEKLCLSW